jgi:hypothetical protein
MVSHRALVAVFVAGLATIFLMSGPPVPSIAQPHEPAAVESSQHRLKRLPRSPSPKIDKVIPDEIIIKYKPQFLPPKDAVKERDKVLRSAGEVLRNKFGAESIFTNPDLGWILMKLPPGLSYSSVVDDLAKDERIEYATPDYEITLHGHTTAPPADWLWTNHFDPLFGSPYSSYSYLWGLDKIGMEQAWTLSHSQGGGVLIAILDQAIDDQHSDLKDNYDSVVGGISYCTSPPPSKKDWDHGTYVAGIIAAVGDNGSSPTSPTFVVGVNRKARFIPVRIACENPTIGKAIQGINYAKTKGAAVINGSWGLYLSASARSSASVSNLLSDLQTEIMSASTTLYVASAGNENRNLDACPEPKIFPQMFGLDNVIVVAATDPDDALWVEQPPIGDPCFPSNSADNPNRKSGDPPPVYGSNFGVTTVDIAAPGQNIFSVLPESEFGAMGNPIQKYVSIAGETSAAAPFVAGCAALLQSRQLAIHPLSPFTPQQLKSILMGNGTSLPVPGQVASGKRLNCFGALLKVPEDPPPTAPTNLRIK